MALEDLLQAKVLYYVITNNQHPHYADKQMVKDYMKARKWLYETTGIEVLAWGQAVIRQEKQLLNKSTVPLAT